MRRGQCVSSCGDGFFQDRHSCAGKPGPAAEKATLTPERSGAARSCAQLFKSERKLWAGLPRDREPRRRETTRVFTTLLVLWWCVVCGEISRAPSACAWGPGAVLIRLGVVTVSYVRFLPLVNKYTALPWKRREKQISVFFKTQFLPEERGRNRKKKVTSGSESGTGWWHLRLLWL